MNSKNQMTLWVLAVAGVAAGYMLAHSMGLPMVWFDSKTHLWSFGERPSTAAMDYFGRSLWSFGFGVVAVLAGKALSLRRPTMRAAWAQVAVAALVLTVCGALEVNRLLHRVPKTETVPDGFSLVTGRFEQPNASPTPLAQR